MGGVVESEGGRISAISVNSAVECGAQCNDANGCESIMYFDYQTGNKGTNCYLFNKTLDGSEPLKGNTDSRFSSYLKVCVLGTL